MESDCLQTLYTAFITILCYMSCTGKRYFLCLAVNNNTVPRWFPDTFRLDLYFVLDPNPHDDLAECLLFSSAVLQSLTN